MATPVHVVSKLNNAEHAVFRINEKNDTLAESSIRVRTWLISLSSNNLSYARSGDRLHWWDVYPVPESSPGGYGNRKSWGIVPAWGYARVIDSTIDAIAPESLIWGMWPTSSHLVDLQLEKAVPDGHWLEKSSHRAQLMTIYNSYEQASKDDIAVMHKTALCKPLWMGPSLLNSNVFSPDRIHPFGFAAPWTEKDADLSSAVVINLSASSKTGRSFSWELSRNRNFEKDGPLALLQLTSVPHSLPQYDVALPMKSMSYDDPDALPWVEQFKPSRVVIVDFGAADAVSSSLTTLASKFATEVTVVAVGSEAKVYTPEELEARMKASSTKVLVNTSGIRDQAIKLKGPGEHAVYANKTWKKCLEDKVFDDLNLKVLKGVEGRQGIEGAWDDLCDRKVPANTGLIVDLSKE